MYLGAVAKPRPEHGFDGKIGLWVIGEEVTAKRSSKYYDKGDVHVVNITMDTDKFIEMCKKDVIPSILKKVTWKHRLVRVQLDNAGGHGVKRSIDELNAYCKEKKYKIEFFTQPARSPDVNALDLGIWNSMQRQVDWVKYDTQAETSMADRIMANVLSMWESYESQALINIFELLPRIMQCIIDENGGNGYRLPRKKEP
jgi:hypothetical protein